MPETCNPKDCPVSARVEALKEEFNTYRANSSNTHRQMFERIGALEQNRAALNEKLDSMDEKLDKVVEYQEAQQAKPERLLDKLKENSFWLVLAAVLGAVLARVGL